MQCILRMSECKGAVSEGREAWTSDLTFTRKFTENRKQIPRKFTENRKQTNTKYCLSFSKIGFPLCDVEVQKYFSKFQIIRLTLLEQMTKGSCHETGPGRIFPGEKYKLHWASDVTMLQAEPGKPPPPSKLQAAQGTSTSTHTSSRQIFKSVKLHPPLSSPATRSSTFPNSNLPWRTVFCLWKQR